MYDMEEKFDDYGSQDGAWLDEMEQEMGIESAMSQDADMEVCLL